MATNGQARMTIDELVENFEFLDEWQERYRYLIELGRALDPLPDTDKTDATKVEGCMSQVWMTSEVDDDGRVRLRAESDAAIVQGLIAVLLTLYSGRTPAEIVKTDVADIFSKIGLDQHLSPNRRNGFFAMVQRIKLLAATHAAAVSSRN